MIAPEIYHTAVEILLDISDQDNDDKRELQPALQYLKNRRLNALKDEAINKKKRKNHFSQ